MDKQFVNIDDLVRQRLGGGEEREQSGSWDRMRDLLDKEMPKRKPAGMYWRRSLSAVALLLLIGSAGVGAYTMVNGRKAVADANANDLIAATANNSTGGASPNTITSTNTEPTNNNEIASNNNTTNDNKNTTNDNKNNTKATLAATTKNNDGEAKPFAPNNDAVKEHKHHKAANATVTAPGVAKVTAIQKHTHANAKPIAANGTPNANEANGDSRPTGHASKTADGKTTASVATGGDKAGHHKVVADNKENNKDADGKETMSEMALASGTPSVKSGTPANTKHGVAHNTASSGAVKAKHIAHNTAIATTSTSDNDADSDAQPLAGDNTANKHVAANKPAKQSAHKTGANPATMANMPLASNNATGGAAGKAPVTSTVKTTRKAQRQVERLVLAEHMVRISPTEMKYVVDTISKEVVMEEYELAIAPPAYGPVTYENYLNTVDETTTTAVAKDNHVRRLAKTSNLENLSAAFNDMKTTMGGAHFNGGLTAGINGTFFGPNSFKGFQFGGSGTLTFSETVAIMAELKYFHRVNNNYSLNDNYYMYSPSVGGGYTRVLVNNPYSLSTLHSIELPISVRYCTGNFNFFVGGNFEYSFAVNTGAYPLPDPATATQVAAIGNDNTPKIQNDDFKSKFGFGYLVGASCKVSPNVAIDFRSVQNVWDNSKTDGAKYISGQLYRSPSLQLSLTYRLGGNKEKK